MTLGTIIKLPDGRIGTICWRHLDGEGGVWGERDFSGIEASINDDLPAPEFLLREKICKSGFDLESHLRAGSHRSDLECVGEDYEIIEKQESK
ncbi:hypothetical protein M0R72_10700 [Candidatus Pacearchaeota archaeon]|jgi:hypothetical protein|nr:hypothetical protein [Candidatus Pacearchaeota archaeon]